MPATKPRAYQVYDIDWKQAVRALSDSNINLASPGALVIDAVVLDPYDRVLLTAQTNATENGIYQVNAAQTLLVPATDWVNSNSGLSSAVNSGLTVTVTEGADYAQTTWTLTNPNPIIIGVTAIVFEPVPEASDRIGNIYFDGATIELANGASETAIAIRPNGTSGLAGITIPDDAAANSFSLNIFNFANAGNVKIDTNSGDWVFDYSGNLTATGYITANYFVGDGGLLSNISVVDGYSNANVANYLPTYSGNLASLTGNVTTNANISGSYILGNGRQLSGIDRISNGTSNIVILDNGNVEITSGSETWFFINSGAMHCPPVSTIYAEGTGEMSLQVANNTIAEATLNLGYNGAESTYIQITAEAEDERLAEFELTANYGSNNFARIITFDGNSQNYFWKFSGDGIFLVPGDIIPVANGSRSLGNVTNQWNDLYVSNNTIYLGNVPLAVTSANGLTIDGQAVLSNASNVSVTTTGNITANYFLGNIQSTEGNIFGLDSFNFTVENISARIANNGVNIGAGGFNNLLVLPTDVLIQNVPLTVAGNIVANEVNGLYITANAPVGGTARIWNFGTDGRLTFPGTPRIDTDSDNFEVQAAENISLEANAVVNIYTDTSGTAYQWQFGDDGDLNLPANGTIVGVTDDNSGYLQWLGNSSGDGLGYTTLILVPDDTVSSQVLVLDPTAPGHIHLRSPGIGGNIEQPTANIFLGPEDTSFEITAQYADAPEARIHSGGNTWTFDNTGNLTAPGNVIFADNYVYSGNTFTSPETNGILKNFKWKFSDTVSGADTVTLQWNLLDTTFPQWYLTTNSQGNIYVFDGDAKTLGFLANSINSGTVTFGTAANNGAGGSNDIELTTVTGNAYVRVGSNSWQFDNNGTLSAPGNITTTGNVSADYLVVSGGIRATGASPAPTLSGFSSISTVSATGNITASGTLIANVGIITTGNITGNTAGFAIGYRDIPQVSFTGNATISATDAGKHFYSTESTNYVLTIANNSSQVFQVGTAITVVNRGTGTITIAQGSGVSLYLAGNSTAGNRTISTYGMASLLNVAANVWMINGTGVT